MARILQHLGIISVLGMVLLAYLFHLPNSENLPQRNRIRMLGAIVKVFNFVGLVAEQFSLTNEIDFLRNIALLTKKFKHKDEDAGLEIEDTTIEGVSVRIYRPLSLKNDNDTLHPAIVYYHGGAFYLCSIDTHNSVTSTLARDTGFIVISVDYRLVPEYPFPAGLDDCMAVTKYVLQKHTANKLRIDHTRVAIAGDSAGGNFAAVIAMRLAQSDDKQLVPRVQVLIYPVVQFFDFLLPSYLQPIVQIFRYATGDRILSFYLNKTIDKGINTKSHTTIEQKKYFRSFVNWSLIPSKYRQIYQKPLTDDIEGDPILISNTKQMLHPDLSPLLVDDKQLAKLPRTYVLTVEHDRLRDEGIIYATRVKASGVPVVHHHFDNTFHGVLPFLTGPFGFNVAKEMLNNIVNYLKDNLK